MQADGRAHGVSSDLVARALTDAADAAVVISSSGGIEYANHAFARLTGFAPDVLAATSLDALAVADMSPSTAERMRDLLSGVAASVTHLAVITREDGTPVAVEHTCRAFEAVGRRLAVSTFVRAADRVRAAAALSASDARCRELFEEDACGRFEAAPDWQITRCNGALVQMLGCTEPSDLLGRSLLDHSADPPALLRVLALAQVSGRAGPSGLQFQSASGELIDVSCSIAVVTDAAGVLASMRGTIVDVTAATRVQSRLLGAERMELLARLAGGLAHDFNNLLTVIKGHSERLAGALPADGPLRESALAIDQASAAAASLTRQLLAFGRRQVFELRPLSLVHLLTDSEPMLRTMLGDSITLRVVAGIELPDIRADARQIEDVVVNLAMNAREAMPSGGTLSIRVDTMDVGARTPRDRRWLRPGRYVRLLVSDTGHGMDPVAKAHAFQPFFTTKQMGMGRGLGLATVYGIVKQSNGFVWVESSAGKGAAFTLLFPALGNPQPASTVATTAHEAILVVETDETFRHYAGEALRRRGYEALLATSATEAVELFASHPSRIHLLVANGGVQTAEGVPLAARLTAIDPMLQSLVVLEGETRRSGGGSVLPTTPVIQKPFTLQALADKVRAVLDSGEGRV